MKQAIWVWSFRQNIFPGCYREKTSKIGRAVDIVVTMTFITLASRHFQQGFSEYCLWKLPRNFTAPLLHSGHIITSAHRPLLGTQHTSSWQASTSFRHLSPSPPMCQCVASMCTARYVTVSRVELLTINWQSCTITISWLKAATTAFTFKTLLRYYAKRALTPQ